MAAIATQQEYDACIKKLKENVDKQSDSDTPKDQLPGLAAAIHLLNTEMEYYENTHGIGSDERHKHYQKDIHQREVVEEEHVSSLPNFGDRAVKGDIEL